MSTANSSRRSGTNTGQRLQHAKREPQVRFLPTRTAIRTATICREVLRLSAGRSKGGGQQDRVRDDEAGIGSNARRQAGLCQGYLRRIYKVLVRSEPEESDHVPEQDVRRRRLGPDKN